MKKTIEVQTLPGSDLLGFTLNEMAPWEATVEQVRDCVLENRMVGAAIDGHYQEQAGIRDYMQQALPLVVDAVRNGRMMDVGYIPNAVIGSEAKRVKRLVHEGWLRQPFEEGWVLYHRWEGGVAPLFVLPHDERSVYIAELSPCIMEGTLRVLMLGDVGLLTPSINPITQDYGYQAAISVAAVRRAVSTASLEQQSSAAASNLGDPVWTALALLNTDGVGVEKIPAPERLNRQRVRKGKHPIPSRFKVHSEGYVTAITAERRGGGASHAAGDGSRKSPVMHLRRGHVRRLADGKQTWVRDALIGGREGGLPTRSHYELRGGPRRG
jgi:hypothetical protein